jgi:uncharacterized membrane protein (UPF0182 family)
LVVAVAITVLTAAPVFGSAAAGRWEVFLLFLNKVSFGVSDAEFGQDLSFFIVTVRMLNFVQAWVMGILIVSAVMSLFLYAGIYGLRGLNFFLAPRMLKHIGILPLYSPRTTLTISSGIIRILRREYFLRSSFDIGAQICLFTTWFIAR